MSASGCYIFHFYLEVEIILSMEKGGNDGDADGGEGLGMLWVDGSGGSSTLGGMFPARVEHNAPSVQAGQQELVLQQGRGGHQWPDDVNHPELIHSDKQPPPSTPHPLLLFSAFSHCLPPSLPTFCSVWPKSGQQKVWNHTTAQWTVGKKTHSHKYTYCKSGSIHVCSSLHSPKVIMAWWQRNCLRTEEELASVLSWPIIPPSLHKHHIQWKCLRFNMIGCGQGTSKCPLTLGHVTKNFFDLREICRTRRSHLYSKDSFWGSYWMVCADFHFANTI